MKRTYMQLQYASQISFMCYGTRVSFVCIYTNQFACDAVFCTYVTGNMQYLIFFKFMYPYDSLSVLYILAGSIYTNWPQIHIYRSIYTTENLHSTYVWINKHIVYIVRQSGLYAYESRIHTFRNIHIYVQNVFIWDFPLDSRLNCPETYSIYFSYIEISFPWKI